MRWISSGPHAPSKEIILVCDGGKSGQRVGLGIALLDMAYDILVGKTIRQDEGGDSLDVELHSLLKGIKFIRKSFSSIIRIFVINDSLVLRNVLKSGKIKKKENTETFEAIIKEVKEGGLEVYILDMKGKPKEWYKKLVKVVDRFSKRDREEPLEEEPKENEIIWELKDLKPIREGAVKGPIDSLQDLKDELMKIDKPFSEQECWVRAKL